MGRRLRYPRFTHGFIDRHGKPRFYLRRPGFKQTSLPGLPWSPEFMAAYEAALSDQPKIELGASRTMPGTIRALAVSYFNSVDFRSLEPSTQAAYRYTIDAFTREHGDKRTAVLRREHIVRLMEGRKPEAANKLRRVLRAMMTHAIDVGYRADDPTRDVKAVKIKTDGYHAWTESEIEQYMARHPIGTRAGLALALLLHTGQRRGDVIVMGRQHIRGGAIHVRQHKTKVELLIPVHADLQAALDRVPVGQMSFLLTELGKPFTGTGFSNWFREQCDMAGLRHCSAHGLRKAAARRLAEAGCTAHEIAAITGHASLREIVRYTKAADQQKLAVSAMDKAKKTRTGIG